MSLFVVLIGFYYEGESIVAAFPDLDAALEHADGVSGGDCVIVEECNPLPIREWERDGYRAYQPKPAAVVYRVFDASRNPVGSLERRLG